MNDTTYYGIDLGTTYSALTCYNSRDSQISRLTEFVPSFVDLNSGLVGSPVKLAVAKKKAGEHSQIYSGFKVDMFTGLSGRIPRIASTKVLEYLVAGYKDLSAVITAPAYFNDAQRKATKEAAVKAGIQVRALINEPTSAAVAYKRYHPQQQGVFVVYDLGGGTFDTTIVDYSDDDKIDVLATDGLKIGGNDLNAAILSFLCKKAGIKLHSVSEALRSYYLEMAEEIKLAMQKTQKNCTFHFEDRVTILTVEEYERIVQDIFGITVIKLKGLLAKYEFQPEEYDILLVGGSTRDPYLQRILTDQVKKPLPMDYDPDFLVAEGSSLYSYMLSNELLQERLSDVTKAIGVQLNENKLRKLIPPNSALPVTESWIFVNVTDSGSARVKLYQTNSALPTEDSYIGTLEYQYGAEMSAFEGYLCVSISMDKNGILTAMAKEPLGVVVELQLRV